MKQEVLILSTESNHDWVRFFAGKIAEEVQHSGLEVLYVDIQAPDAMERLNCVNNVTEQPIFVMCFEGAGFLIPSIVGPNWIDLLGSRIYAYFSQHPLFYKKQLMAAQSWNISPRFTDSTCVAYMQKYHTQYEGVASVIPVGFAGTNADRGWENRNIDIFIPCDYKSPKVFREAIEELPDAFRVIGEALIEGINANPAISMDVYLEEKLDELGVGAEQEEMLELMEMYSGVYEYVRNESLGRLVKGCVASGKKVTVCGEGWEEWEEVCHPFQRVGEEGGLPFREMLEYMGDSKMVALNHRKHPNEISLTLMCAMANGAVVYTDRNEALMTEFQEGDDILFYDGQNVDSIGEHLQSVWREEDKLSRIAMNGKKTAQKLGNIREFVQSMLPKKSIK